MTAQGLLALACVSAVFAYAAADRDDRVSYLIPTLLIDDRGCDYWAGFSLAESSSSLLGYMRVSIA